MEEAEACGREGERVISCPHCEKDHDPGDWPDHEEGDYIECDCGETFS